MVSNCPVLHNRIWHPAEYTGCYTYPCSAIVANYCVLGTHSINMKLQFCYITLLNSSRYCISIVQELTPVEKVQFICTGTLFKYIFTVAANLSLDTWKKCLPRNRSIQSFSQDGLSKCMLRLEAFSVQSYVLCNICICVA